MSGTRGSIASGDERREVVDYLSGRGLVLDRFIHEAPVEGWGREGAGVL